MHHTQLFNMLMLPKRENKGTELYVFLVCVQPSTSGTQSRGSSLSPMDSLNSLPNFESEMEPDGQGNYSLFPALDSIATLSGTSETLER